MSATFLGAVIFSLTRTKKERIPQEAIIGIVYAVSAAFAILILSRFPEGDEEIRHMLVGNILLVDFQEIVKMAALYGIIGFFHWYFRETFILISTQPEKAIKKGISIKGWDIVFYLTFGFVVTSSVQIAGVLLVFSFLIVPAVAAILFFDGVLQRLLFGWGMGLVTSFLGIFLSYQLDLPTGATVVCVFGGFLLLFSLFQRLL